MDRQTTILRAKLMRPRTPSRHVRRERLLDEQLWDRPVVLVSGSAAVGKTVLVCSWLDLVGTPCAWLSIDPSDNDAAHFFRYLVAALSTLHPELSPSFASAAQHLQAADLAVMMPALANALLEGELSGTLVLDDYHHISRDEIHEAITYLAEHAPPGLRLILTSRREPPLPLPRWRMRQWLTELDAEELRFRPEECRAFLRETLAIALSDEEVALLEQRTEGWVGGMQLAALSLSGRADRGEFLERFAGDDRYVMDYLTSEVLAHQPEEVRRFLLRSSVLERMNASLCRAVTGDPESAERLEALERDHLFVVALDTRREWYRLHHLFRSLLNHQLMCSDTESAAACHLQASTWLEREGAVEQAIQHAWQARSEAQVAQILEVHSWSWVCGGRAKQVHSWMSELAEATIAERPELLRTALWTEYIRSGSVNEQRRERLAQGGEHEIDLRILKAYEAARRSESHAEARSLAEEVLEAEGLSDFLERSAQSIAATCAHAAGETQSALRRYELLRPALLKQGMPSLFSFLSVAHGRLEGEVRGPEAALALHDRAYAEAESRGWERLPVTAMLHLGLGWWHWWLGSDDQARLAWERGLTLAEHEPTTVRHAFQWRLARLLVAIGEAGEAEQLVAETQRTVYIAPLLPIDFELELECWRYHIDRGAQDDAREAMQRMVGGDEHRLGPARAWTLGRHHLAARRPTEAASVLTLAIAESSNRSWWETARACRVLLAVARFLEGAAASAMEQLDAALATPGTDGSASGSTLPLRPFLEAPAELDALLRKRLEGSLSPELAASIQRIQRRRGDQIRPRKVLDEPLTPSETRVLEQLLAGRSNKEIAAALFISPNTLKTHIRKLYGKLEVKSRSEAILKAQSLGLASI